MPKTRQQKETELTKLTDRLSRMKSLVLTTTAGLKVKDVTALRKTMLAEGAEYVVVKKTILTRALKKAGMGLGLLDDLTSGFALSFGFSDPVAPVKALAAFQKEHEMLEFRGGIVEGAAYSAEQLKELSKLPSRPELLAKFIGSIAAPLSGFVRTLSGPAASFVRLLEARRNSLPQ